MRCSRAWDKSGDFQLLMHNLLKQGYVDPRLKSLLHKLRDRHREMIDSDDILKLSGIAFIKFNLIYALLDAYQRRYRADM
jgi:hypothetical protein